MKTETSHLKMICLLLASFLVILVTYTHSISGDEKKLISLPDPSFKGTVSVEEAIKARRCIRGFQAKPLTMKQLSQILWAAQGITQDRGYKRAAPSAGALYPLEIFAVVGKNGIKGLDSGVYQYIPRFHSIEKTLKGDLRENISKAALDQKFIAQAPIVIIITADYNRTAKKYGNRTLRYVHIEVGHAGENIMLQGISIGLSSAIVGAFYDDKISSILQLPPELHPLLVIPVGYKK